MTAPAGTWPEPNDTQTQRARKVATGYRELLRTIIDKKLSPDEADTELAHHDKLMRSYGQHWVTGIAASYDNDEWVDADTAGEILGIVGSRISQLRKMGRIPAQLVGRAFLYRVGDVRAYQPLLRDSQAKRRAEALAEYQRKLAESAANANVNASSTSAPGETR